MGKDMRDCLSQTTSSSTHLYSVATALIMGIVELFCCSWMRKCINYMILSLHQAEDHYYVALLKYFITIVLIAILLLQKYSL